MVYDQLHLGYLYVLMLFFINVKLGQVVTCVLSVQFYTIY